MLTRILPFQLAIGLGVFVTWYFWGDGLDFSSVKAPTLTTQEGVEYQRSMRDEW